MWHVAGQASQLQHKAQLICEVLTLRDACARAACRAGRDVTRRTRPLSYALLSEIKR